MTAVAGSNFRGQQQQQDDAKKAVRPTSNPISKNNSITTAATAAVRLAAIALVATANAAVYNVSPDGNPMTLTAALDSAGAGDTISLGNGVYREPIVTMNAGEDGNPLVIEGGRDAVINYFSGEKSMMWSQKVVDIRHSWITLRGFTIDGHLDDQDDEDSYVDKCIWIEGQDDPTMVPYSGREVKTSLIGTVIEDMKIHNCGMECIRMRNWVTNSVIIDNDIEDCGIYDFQFRFDGKIGEAIYIGTSSNQWTDGEDGCNYNLVKNNKLVPRANECVDIKEGSTMNVVEYNDCQDQRDRESGCFDSRGNDNTFRYNTAEGCEGAGIRLGGHEINGFVFGVDNHVYGNEFSETENGAIKARNDPQGVICDNSCKDGDCDISEEGDDEEIEDSWDRGCPSDLPSVPFIDDDDDIDADASSEGFTSTTTGETVFEGSEDDDDDAPRASEGFTSTTPGETVFEGSEDDDLDAPRDFPRPTPETNPFCDGVLGDDIYCCSAGCGECGGKGCASRGDGLTAADCCRSNIEDSGKMCSETGVAPCIVDAGSSSSSSPVAPTDSLDEITSTPIPIVTTTTTTTTSSSGDDDEDNDNNNDDEYFTCDGVLGDDIYCCTAGCGVCGGEDCSNRGDGLDGSDCCRSDIKKSGNMCSETGKAPCLVDLPLSTTTGTEDSADADPARPPTPSYTNPFCDGVVGDDIYCCTTGCGVCGGDDCSNRGEGLDGSDCCRADIKKSGKMCSETGKAPCLL